MGTIFGLIIFLVASVFVFTGTGVLLIKRLSIKLGPWEIILLGTVTGFALFSLIAYFLMLLNFTVLLVPLFLYLAIVSIPVLRETFRKVHIAKGKQLAALLAVFILGVIGQLAVIAPSGTLSNGDLVFRSAHGHDGPWHIALMNELQNGYPFQNPVFAGEKLVNYHFFSDVAPAVFNQYLKLDALDLYFRFFPLFFSLLLGASAYLLGKRIGGSFASGIWVAIFTYFAGSFGFVVTWLRDQTIGGESIFWATQIQSSSGNPPQIISNFFMLTFLLTFAIYLKDKNWKILVPSLFIVGTLSVFKVYAAIVVLAGLGVAGVWQIFRERRYTILIFTMAAALLSALLFLPNTSGGANFLIWEPWWYIRTMIVTDSRLDWIDHELRRQTFIYENNWKRVIQLEMTAFGIFIFGNLGMRFLAFPEYLKMVRGLLRNYFYQIYIVISLVSLVFPLLFLQRGVASNTSQFLQYFILLFGVSAGVFTAKILSKVKHPLAYLIISSAVILLSLPTQLGLLYDFYGKAPLAKISKQELQALDYLKTEGYKNAVILTPAYNKYLDLGGTPPHIWDWFDTAYVAAFSSGRTFISDTEQVDIMGYRMDERLAIQKAVFDLQDPQEVEKLLVDNNINYLYFPKSIAPEVDLYESSLSPVYSNELIEIWKLE